MTQTKKKYPNSYKNSYLEQIKDLSSGSAKSTKNTADKRSKFLWDQYWGTSSQESYESITSSEKIERKEAPKRAAYETRQDVILYTASEQQTAREIEILRTELDRLIKTVKEVDFEVQKAVMEIPAKPGVYHVRFLERVRKILKLIREELEDSKTWLKLSISKRRQKCYWSMYKKKGTSFGLSGERVVSTQTG